MSLSSPPFEGLLRRLRAATEDENTNPTPEAPVPVVTAEDRRFVGGKKKESTAWDVYNNEAKLVDDELVKDWKESLGSLLLFTGIFAAVLAAFIVESKKMLEQDQAVLLVNATIFGLNRKGDEEYIVPPFEPTKTAISINCLLFASLGITLISALASVMALQWVTDYDVATTRSGSSPEDHAKRRQFRFAGVHKWRMSTIIASLPILLYTSVVLFWAGAILWMFSICPLIGRIISCSLAMAVIFYVSTTLLAGFYAEVPYRTQLSRGIYWLSRIAIHRVSKFIHLTGLKCLFLLLQAYSQVLRGLGVFIPAIRTSQARPQALLEEIRAKLPALRFPKGISIQEQERREAERNPWLREQALVWVVRQLPGSMDSHKRALILLNELISHAASHELSPKLFEVWWDLIDSLGWQYMQKVLHGTLKESEYDGVEALVRCSTVQGVRENITPVRISRDKPYETDISKSKYWEQCCLPSETTIKTKPDTVREVNMAFLLARDVPIPSSRSKTEMKATIKLIKWRNSTEPKILDIWREVFAGCESYSAVYRESCLRQFSRVVIAASFSRPRTGEIWPGMVRVNSFVARPSVIRPDVALIFSDIIEWALKSDFTSKEAFALAHAFEDWITQQRSDVTEGLLPENVIRRLLQYAKLLKSTGSGAVAMHYNILMLVARTVTSLPKPDQPRWARWILMMLWLVVRYSDEYWDEIMEKVSHGENTGAANLWQTIDCRYWIMDAQHIPYIREIIQILDLIIGADDDLNSLWVGSTDADERRCKLIRVVKTFDQILGPYSTPRLHASSVRLVGRDMNQLGRRWASSNDCQNHIPIHLAQIRDPCLALLGRFVSEVPSSVEVALTRDYIGKYRSSLTLVSSLFYRELSITDPPPLWWLRGSLIPFGGAKMEELYRASFGNMQDLSYVERLFETRTYCYDHSSGAHHMLFHLYRSSPTLSSSLFPSRCRRFENLFEGLDLKGMNLSPVLAILALSADEDISSLTFEYSVNVHCARRIWELCKAVKATAAEFLLFITDITNEEAARSNWPGMARVVKVVNQVIALPQGDSTTTLWYPLLKALQNLRRSMTLDNTENEEEKRSIITRLGSMLRIILDRSLTEPRSSGSQHRLISCARTNSALIATAGWLEMHEDMSKSLAHGAGNTDPYWEMTCNRESDRVNRSVHGSLHYDKHLACARSYYYGTLARSWRQIHV